VSRDFIPVKVAAIQHLAPAIRAFDLVADHDTLPRFTPGSHVETKLIAAGQTYVRPFSLCGPLHHKGRYRIAIRRHDRRGSATALWHDCVEAGSTVEISLPINHFPLSRFAKRHVFIAGGIGITPMLPMMEQLMDEGTPFELHYAAPDLEHCAFSEEIEKRFGQVAQFYFSRTGSRLSAQVLARQPVGTHVYLCGPEAMQRALCDEAIRYGYPSDHIHFERFGRPRRDDDRPFHVMLAKQKRLIRVEAEETLLEALQREGIPVPSSCRAGGCGTCKLPVLSGTVDHRDFFLDEEEKEAGAEILACVSRAVSERLVLDL
jgi:dimethylamine monooxygenase subunit B